MRSFSTPRLALVATMLRANILPRKAKTGNSISGQDESADEKSQHNNTSARVSTELLLIDS